MKKKKGYNPKDKDFRKSKFSSKTKDEDISGGSRMTSKTNDPAWYTRNGQLTKDAYSLPFTWPVGRGLPVDYAKGKTVSSTVHTEFNSVPGIMSIKLAPFPGKSLDENSPINVASRNIYSYVRHANSGHSNYDAPDLMMYIMAMDSLYSMYEWGKRAYGTLALANQTNRYYPKQLVRAQGFNYDDLLSHIVDLRAYLNVVAIKLSSLCVPSSLSLVKRHRMLFSSIYRDSDDPKSQLYLYTPGQFYIYDETSGAGKLGGGLPSYSAGAFTFDMFVQSFNDRINRVMGSEDMNIMSGDILKAFGEGNLETLQQIPEDYVCIPERDDGVLYQIRNATLVGEYPADLSWDITQDVTTGALLCNPYFENKYSTGDLIPAFERIMSAPNAAPSQEEVAELSRLVVVADPTTVTQIGETNRVKYALCDFASDVALDAWVWTIDANGGARIDKFCSVTSGGEVFIPVMCAASQFKHHPDVVPFVNGLGILTIKGHFFEFDNYTVVGRHEIATMHEAALLSMYSVPEYGAWDVGVSGGK